MPSVLVTGAGRGIGRTVTLRLAAAGWDVFAGVRKEADGAAVAAAATGPGSVVPVLLDVTDAAQLAALPGALPGGLDAVVNNAGVAVSGPVEGVPLEALRRQLEINVVGQVGVTQAVLPALRASRGRVVFVSSLSGRIATPMTGVYNASKFALEGLADALRMEVRPWGIRVTLVEPAQTDTDMWQQAEAALDADLAKLTPAHRELYVRHIAGARKMIPQSQKLAGPADAVAAAVERALTATRPKARYIVGRGPQAQALLAALTPTPVLDRVLSAAIGVPRRA